jgi:16S rRNA (uracil1498-N3)-methyltransferase
MNRPPRFLISTGGVAHGVARIAGRELHHMRDVMRLVPGAEVTLLDSSNIEHLGRLIRFEGECAIVELAAGPGAAPDDAGSLTLAAAIIKGPRMDFLVEKAAELGAAVLWPLACARSVVKNPGSERLTRWRRLAAAAAKQSLVPRIMEIEAPLTVAAMTRNVPKEALAIVCAVGAEPLGALLHRQRPCDVILACGPEGDFDDTEAAAMGAAGFVPAGLGRGRLRSETAALAALAIAADAMSEINRGS